MGPTLSFLFWTDDWSEERVVRTEGVCIVTLFVPVFFVFFVFFLGPKQKSR